MERRILIKAAVLIIFLCGALWLVTRPESQAYLSKQAIQEAVRGYGLLGPLVFVAVFAVAGVLLVPATVFVFAGAVLFGTWRGFSYSLLGATLAAALSFLIARTLGYDLVRRLVGERLRKYDERIAKDGFGTILYLRLIFMPFAVINYGAGLTKVRFKEYLLATIFGLIPSIFIFTFFFSKVTVTRLSDLYRWEVLVAAVLLVFALCLPFIVKRYFRPRNVRD